MIGLNFNSNQSSIMQPKVPTIKPAGSSVDFPDATIVDLKIGKDLKSDSTLFNYTISGFELGNQTSDALDRACANSAKGQHIHLLLNNEPYEAWYEKSFKKKLAEGHYVALSFLSRSYHESLKGPKAYKITQFNVGKNAGTTKDDIDLKAPMVFFSRPKGEYIGEDAKKILFDFYVVNAKISDNEYKISYTLNTTSISTMGIINKWEPYFIENLPMGKSSIKLQLIGKDGKPLTGPHTSAERSFELREQ